jgi:hypothetical protein
MNPEPKFPPWLTFVDRAAEDAPLLRLLMLNPINGATSAFINREIAAGLPLFTLSAEDPHAKPPSDL